MQYVCDGVGTRTWFRLETAAEATSESRVMDHAVEKYFSQAHDQAVKSYVPPASARVPDYLFRPEREPHRPRTRQDENDMTPPPRLDTGGGGMDCGRSGL